MSDRTSAFKACLLLMIGLLQIAGNGFHLPGLSGAGFATAASPAPQVFCRLGGVETFASFYYLEWKDNRGRDQALALGPGTQGLIPGPQARRSMYLRTLTGEVVAEKSMLWSVKRYAVCGPLLSQMGIQRGNIQWPAHLRIVTPGDSLVPTAVIPFGDDCP